MLFPRKFLKEYFRTIECPKFSKFSKFKDDSVELIEEIKGISEWIKPNQQFRLLKDSEDNKFLDMAYLSHADFLITGNTQHFPYRKFEQTEIISPKKYRDTYWNDHAPL